MSRSDGDHALMRRAVCDAVEGLARFKPHSDVTTPAELDNLLKTRAAGSAGNEKTIQRPSRGERLPNRMNPRQNTHNLTLPSRVGIG